MLRRTTAFLAKPCPNTFVKALTKNGWTAFFGVPDSLLKEFAQVVDYHGAKATADVGIEHHVITANEGNAIGLATGYHLATNKVPVVYMQNSGLGNCVNPLLSMTHSEVYRIPMVLVIGWRGRPGAKKDEPQHVAQGRRTEHCLDACEVPHTLLSCESDVAAQAALDEARAHVETHKTPFAILVDRDTFGAAPAEVKQFAAESKHGAEPLEMTREDAIERVLKNIPATAPVVSTTGMPSREVFETRVRLGQSNASDFLTVGAMGHCSSIAAGVAMGMTSKTSDKKNKVVCIDGDGGMLMHMGAVAVNGGMPSGELRNLLHVCVNNGAHGSVGGQATVGFEVDLTAIARDCGYRTLPMVDSFAALDEAMAGLKAGFFDTEAAGNAQPVFLEVRVNKAHRKDLGRPTSSAADNRAAFMDFVEKVSAGALPQ